MVGSCIVGLGFTGDEVGCGGVLDGSTTLTIGSDDCSDFSDGIVVDCSSTSSWVHEDAVMATEQAITILRVPVRIFNENT